MSAAASDVRKSVDNTVFVRFVPPSDAIRRHHVEDLFSDCGPIKKTSVIHTGGGGAKDASQGQQQQSKPNAITSSYGFVKYTMAEDAALAAIKLNNRTLKVAPGITVTVKVELAQKENTLAPKQSKASKRYNSDAAANERHSQPQQQQQQQEKSTTQTQPEDNPIKKTNRLILRNLSFYAKESDIRKVLEPFGELVEVHIPKVQGGGPGTTHRGFGFVTFAAEKAVKKCLAAPSESLIIKERPVNVARSLHKTAYQSAQPTKLLSIKEKQSPINKKEDDMAAEDDANIDGGHDDDDENDIDQSEDSDDAEEDDIDEGEDDDENPSTPQTKPDQTDDRTAVSEGRCIFLRNLPFDCSRHDVFEAFRRFGFITSIYLVKDKETQKIPKGTAFVSFRSPDHASKALECAAAATPAATNTADSTSFVTQRNASAASDNHLDNSTSGFVNEGGIVVKGRRLLADLAVDKNTASNLTVSEKGSGEIGGKDRRNLRLKTEGRVANDEKAGILYWDELPEGDKLKRQTAWSEKNTKLRSPLFFINPTRLSLRNLAKHVDEAELKKLIVDSTVKGLTEGLVAVEDQVAHWRASGDMTTRDILARIQKASDDSSGKDDQIIPVFDVKNVKQSIPSLHIHRDMAPGHNKKVAPSRGFGFVEFEHHVHALACLRELNNNTRYSAEYAVGGKQAMDMKRRRMGKKQAKDSSALPILEEEGVGVGTDGKVRIPRLIVEFTVENKAKAKQQANHKAQQLANLMSQKSELRTEAVKATGNKTKEKKKSRGAVQREKKRKRLEGGDEVIDTDSAVANETDPAVAVPTQQSMKKVNPMKPPAPQKKIDKVEANFSKLVASYEEKVVAQPESSTASKKSGRRWFE